MDSNAASDLWRPGRFSCGLSGNKFVGNEVKAFRQFNGTGNKGRRWA